MCWGVSEGDDILQFQIVIMQRQRKTNLALQQLGILLNPNDDNDKYELGEILVDILAYPTIEEAETHRSANRLGNFDLLSQQGRLIELLNNNDGNELQLCPCCGNIVNQQKITYTSDLDNIKLGVGVRLYFMSLLYHILIFFIGFFLYSIYALVTNSNASNYSSKESSTSNIGLGYKLQLNETYKNQLAVQSVLGFIYILIWGIVLANKYFKQRKLELQLKNDWLSASEFTLMIKNVPKEIINQSQDVVLRNVNDIFRDYEKIIKSKISFEVVKVNVGYPLFKQQLQQEEVRKLNQEALNKKRNLFTEWLTQRRHKEYFELEEEKRTEIYQNFYDFITNVYLKSDIQNVELQEKSTIFVTLRYSKARQMIEKLNRERSKIWDICTDERDDRLLFPIPNVEITKAPEPDEIKWENIGFDQSVKIIRKILIFGLALVLIGISLTINILLAGYSIGSNQYFISILISLVITIINFIIETIIILVSLFENQYIKSQEEASIGLKIAASQILNSVLVPLLLTYIKDQQVFASNGLVTNAFFIALINMLLPIGRFIDPFNIILKFREKYYCDPEKRLFDLKGQAELNKIFTFYEFQLGYEYSYIIRTSFITAFFMTAQPIIAIFAPIGLILMYLTNKYRLLYRFKKPNFHSSTVNTMLTFILKLSVVAFSLGQLYFINFQQYSIKFNLVINWVSLGFSIAIVLFPLQICKRYYEQPQTSGMDYNEKLLYLTTDYDRVNPVTKQQAINEFRQYLEQYQKKCHLPLPMKSQMIRRSIIQVQKHDPMVSFINLRQKTKTKIFHNRQFLGVEPQTGDRLR